MARGRPRLYHTAEERMMANRAKSTRSYRKRKDPLNISKPVRFRHRPERKGVIPGSTQVGLPEGIDPTDLAGWMALLRDTQQRYEDYTGGCIGRYVDKLSIRYLNKIRSQNIFDDALIEIGAFDKVIARCHASVLRVAGVGAELQSVECIQRRVWACEAAVEDAYTYALGGRSEFTEMREKGQLLYQTYQT